jgi:hypothetical protein
VYATRNGDCDDGGDDGGDADGGDDDDVGVGADVGMRKR